MKHKGDKREGKKYMIDEKKEWKKNEKNPSIKKRL